MKFNYHRFQMKKCLLSILILSCLILSGGCDKLPTGKKGQIHVIAPAFMKDVFDLAAAQFFAEHKIVISIDYVPQGSIEKHIDSLTKVDLVLFLNPERRKKFEKNPRMDVSTMACPFRISLVTVNRPDGPDIRRVKDLRKDEFRRVVMISPTVSYEGKLVLAALQRFKVWDKLEGKMIPAKSARQLQTYLESGEADVAIAFEHTLKDCQNIVIRQRFDEDYKDQLNVCGMLVKDSHNKRVAQAFLDFFDKQRNEIYQTPGIIRID